LPGTLKARQAKATSIVSLNLITLTLSIPPRKVAA
jgi:hypothetical protein